jgi:hypothetical protein
MVPAGGVSWAKLDGGKDGWVFPSEAAGVNSSAISREGNTAVADSSCPLILVHDDVCEALYGEIKGATYSAEHQGWLIPKGLDVGELPELRLAVGEAQFSVNTAEHMFAEAGPDHWYGAVQSRGDSTSDTFGHPFLRSVYAVCCFIHASAPNEALMDPSISWWTGTDKKKTTLRTLDLGLRQ